MMIYICVTVVALSLASASDKLPELVSPSLLWHDGRGINKLFIFSMALLGFGASGVAILYFEIVEFALDSLVFTIPVAVFIILGFVSRHEEGYAAR